MEMNEELILIAGNIVQPEDPLAQFDAIQAVQRYMRDTSNFGWLLENLHTVEHQYSREIILSHIADHTHNNWGSIDSRFHEHLVQEFFTEIFRDENFTSQSQLLYKIYEIQADMVFQFYPETIPNLFQEIVLVPKQHFYGFLSHFRNSLYPNSSIMRRDIDGIKQTMLDDGSQMLLLETVLKDIEAGVPDAIQAISSLVEWIDISILNSMEIVQKLFSIIQMPGCVEDGLLCFINFFKRPNSPETLAEFISSTDIASALEQILSGEISQKAALNAAELINVMVGPLVQTEIADQFLDSAKFLFQYNDIYVTQKIRPFLAEYVLSHTDSVEDISNLSLEKILAVIEAKQADQDLAMQDPLMLLKASAIVARSISSSLTEQIMTLSSQLDPAENMPGCATLLAALVKSVTNTDPQVEIVQMFRGLLEIDAEIDSSYFIAISCYCKLASPYIKDPANREFAIELFRVGANLAINYDAEINTQYHDYLLDTLTKITNNDPEGVFEIDGINDIICSFISSGQDKLRKMASTLSSKLPPDDRVELYSACLTAFSEQIGELEKPSTTTIHPIFDFIYGMNLTDCDAFKPYLKEFFAATKAIPDQDHTTYLPMYVKAVVRTLGIDGFELFWESLGNLDWSVLGEIADAAIGLENPEDLVRVFDLLIRQIHTLPLKSDKLNQDDDLSFSDFHIKCAQFFMRSGVYQLLNEEGQNEVIGEFSDIISNLEASYSIICEIIDFQDQILTERNIPIMMVNSAILAYIFSKKEKDYNERAQAEELLYKYLNFSRHQIAINREAYVSMVDNAYKDSSISTSIRVEYSEIALIEDDDEFQAKAHEFVEAILQSYKKGKPGAPPPRRQESDDDTPFSSVF